MSYSALACCTTMVALRGYLCPHIMCSLEVTIVLIRMVDDQYMVRAITPYLAKVQFSQYVACTWSPGDVPIRCRWPAEVSIRFWRGFSKQSSLPGEARVRSYPIRVHYTVKCAQYVR